MAQAPKEAGGDAAADFVQNVVSDPKNVPDVMLLTGYPGASSEEAHERLYLSPDLSSYVEIPRTAILHQAALPKEQDAHGGVTVWVKKDAALQYKMSPAAQAMANYFAGAIQAQAPGAAAGYGAAGGIQPTPTAIPTRFTPCLPTRFQPQCPYPTEICTHVGACPTRHPGYCPLPEAFAAQAAGQPVVRPTHAVTCAPCLTHAVTCAPCHTVGETVCLPCTHLCTRVGPGCGVAGTQLNCHITWGDCTYFCGELLACSNGLLCAGAAPQAAFAQGPAKAGGVAPDFIGVSMAPGCYWSWGACPTLWGGCGPRHVSYPCTMDPVVQARAPGAGGVAPDFIGVSMAPGCHWSYGACPSLWGGCGPHHVSQPCTPK